MSLPSRTRITLAAVAAIALSAVVSPAVRASGAAAAPAPQKCQSADQISQGRNGDAAILGWLGSGTHAAIAFNNGAFCLRNGVNRVVGYQLAAAPVRLSWTNLGGYLPGYRTAFTVGSAAVTISTFADRTRVGSADRTVIYSRVAVRNDGDAPADLDPGPSSDLVPLRPAATTVRPGRESVHDYVALVPDAPGDTVSTSDLRAAGGWQRHYDHMRQFWNGRLAEGLHLDIPNDTMENAYRAGLIYTLIGQDGRVLNTGANGYPVTYNHDTLDIVTNLFQQGMLSDARQYLELLSAQVPYGPYTDGEWSYPVPWAVYLSLTGDTEFVRRHFAMPAGTVITPPTNTFQFGDSNGCCGTAPLSLQEAAHAVAVDRLGPGHTMMKSYTTDNPGYWTADEYAGLSGLAAYHYIARALGERSEAAWADTEYRSLLDASNAEIAQTQRTYGIDYIPCQVNEANTPDGCGRPGNSRWAAQFLEGRWPWVGYLFDMPQYGPLIDDVAATYDNGFAQTRQVLPADDVGSFYTYTTSYNAGYVTSGLATDEYRTQAIRGYQFLIDTAQTAPFTWWEGIAKPDPGNPWVGTHPSAGSGSSPTLWGQAVSLQPLQYSLLSTRVNGEVVVGRGVPDGWLADPRRPVAESNVPVTGGRRMAFSIRSAAGGRLLTVRLDTPSTVHNVRIALPAFLHGNVRLAVGGRLDRATSSVVVGSGRRTVLVLLDRPVKGSAS